MTGARIAYLVSRFPSVSETFILREVAELHAQGVAVEIFSLKRGRRNVVHAEARALLPHVHYLHPLSPKAIRALLWWTRRAPGRVFSLLADLVRWSWRNPRTFAKTLAVFPECCHFASVMRAIGIRHLHAHMATFQATAALMISRLLGLSYSFTGHASDLLGSFGREVHRRTTLLDVKVTGASFIVSCAPDGRDFLRHAYPELAQKAWLNYHGLDLERFQPGNRPENAVPVILSVGNLLECKGYPYLIEAYRRLWARGLGFRLLVVGEGPLRATLEAQVKTAGLEGAIIFLGAMTQEKLLDLYRVADIFVLPAVKSSHFGIPNVLLEAMAMEIPVIVTDLPAIGELIDSPETGVVIPERDPEALARAIEALLGDPERRRVLGRKGRERVAARFDIRKNVAELKDLLLAAAEGNQSGETPSPLPSPSREEESTLFPRPQGGEGQARGAPITVLHLTYSLDPGGAERMAITLARHISREQYRPVVAYFRGRGPLAEELQAEGIPVYGLGKRHRGAIRPLLRLAHILRQERVQILHTHNWSPNFWGRLVGRAVGVPIVITTEHSMVEARRPGARWANRLLAPLADRIVAVSETVARSHQMSEGIPPARFVTLHNAVPAPTLPERAEARRLLGLESHERILLCLGRLDHPKGQTHLLKVMPAILRHVPEARLLLVGDGPLRPTLEADAKRLALNGQVQFFGYRTDVGAFLAAADALVIPSTREGIPLALLEAMASGLPVVATEVGGIPEVVRHDETGLLVPCGDPAALANAAITLLRDPSRANAMGERGRARYLERFTVERLVRETEALYLALWSQRRAAA